MSAKTVLLSRNGLLGQNSGELKLSCVSFACRTGAQTTCLLGGGMTSGLLPERASPERVQSDSGDVASSSCSGHSRSLSRKHGVDHLVTVEIGQWPMGQGRFGGRDGDPAVGPSWADATNSHSKRHTRAAMPRSPAKPVAITPLLFENNPPAHSLSVLSSRIALEVISFLNFPLCKTELPVEGTCLPLRGTTKNAQGN